jgi:hypothetical protein
MARVIRAASAAADHCPRLFAIIDVGRAQLASTNLAQDKVLGYLRRAGGLI